MAHSIGFRITHQDTEAIARANAFVATADNPSAVYYNPAGITRLEGHNARVGFHAISINSSFRGDAGGTEHSDFAIQPVPHLYYAYATEDQPLAFGLGIFAPFGLALDWGDDVVFRNLAIEGQIAYTTIAPVVAWRLHPTFSIAAGPTLNYVSAFLRRGAGVVPGDEFRFRGNDFCFGAKAGFLWQPVEKVSIGASYFSQSTVTLRGQSDVKPVIAGESGTTADADFPQFIMAGISYRPTPDWNIELGLEWTDWNALNTISFEGTPVGPVTAPFHWQSSFIYQIGVTRELGNAWWVAAGYFFAENSVPDATFNPQVPDTDLHVPSIGFGRRGERWSWAVATHVAVGPERSINLGVGNPANGTYKWLDVGVNLSVGYHF
ncbi:MAG TPA: outer membrane protein transport protein [Methylomirabilota bacterium]|nr:outer membrane protein transport protein [Methylomirabilota bacterium]